VIFAIKYQVVSAGNLNLAIWPRRFSRIFRPKGSANNSFVDYEDDDEDDLVAADSNASIGQKSQKISS